MKRIASLVMLVLALGLVGGPARAATGPQTQMEPIAVDPRDTESLQRGARTFVNYCLNCHSAKYMRYNRLTDLGLTEAQIGENLVLTGRFEQDEDDGGVQYVPTKVGDTMQVAFRAQDAKSWLGAPPPDLSVVARVRGAEWLYNYFLGFYRDERSVTGWNNLVFPNVAMPHVLWQLSGTNRLATAEYPTHEAAQGAAIAEKKLAVIEALPSHRYVVRTVQSDLAGTMNAVEYRRAAQDLVNFLDYMGEPAKATRVRVGIVVLLYLIVLFTAAYWLKRAYWKDLH
jgi:ubiquinol-cytochrome c reductase cytochrome c1 subunit